MEAEERVTRLLASALALALLPGLAFADITGQPRVIDGDTIEVAGQRLRLHGIDAPESRQLYIWLQRLARKSVAHSATNVR